jgi:hypothetical protein
MTSQGTFYEGIDVLVEEGLIDIRLVDRLLRNEVVVSWEKLEPIIAAWRKSNSTIYDMNKQYPVYDSWENLYHRILKLEKKPSIPV